MLGFDSAFCVYIISYAKVEYLFRAAQIIIALHLYYNNFELEFLGTADFRDGGSSLVVLKMTIFLRACLANKAVFPVHRYIGYFENRGERVCL